MNENDREHHYQPKDTELFQEISSFLDTYSPIHLTPEELEAIADLESQQDAMENSIIDFLMILNFIYIASRKKEYLEFYTKMRTTLLAAYPMYRKEKNELVFESRKELLHSYLEKLDEMLVEIEAWRASNWNADS